MVSLDKTNWEHVEVKMKDEEMETVNRHSSYKGFAVRSSEME